MINDICNKIIMAARFFKGLKHFLSTAIEFDELEALIRKRTQRRAQNFLAIVRKAIFENKESPYLRLLNAACISYEQIEKRVHDEGIEPTLRFLREKGVYFTCLEFKGKVPVRRHGVEFKVKESDFDNPFISASYERHSGASRSAGTRMVVDFDFITDTAISRGYITRLMNAESIPHVIVRPLFPYGAGMMYFLSMIKLKINPTTWFSLVDTRGLGISWHTWLGIQYIFFVCKIRGIPTPKIKTVTIPQIDTIIDYLSTVIKEHGGCCVSSNVSTATRICVRAKERGIRLEGVQFQGCGSPLSAQKREHIAVVGAQYMLYYAFTEAGLLGGLCGNPSESDDTHIFKDVCSLITHSQTIKDERVNAFLFTGLLPSMPKILLNVESGDYGVHKIRSCGCNYESLGFCDHVYHVRSFEKLTGEGGTFYMADLIHVIEDLLPQKFGGSSIDYQLIEEEGENGLIREVILVHPRVGDIDERDVIETVINELQKGSDSKKVIGQLWRDAEVISLRREHPITTKAGKVWPLHIVKGELK